MSKLFSATSLSKRRPRKGSYRRRSKKNDPQVASNPILNMIDTTSEITGRDLWTEAHFIFQDSKPLLKALEEGVPHQEVEARLSVLESKAAAHAEETTRFIERAELAYKAQTAREFDKHLEDAHRIDRILKDAHAAAIAAEFELDLPQSVGLKVIAKAMVEMNMQYLRSVKKTAKMTLSAPRGYRRRRMWRAFLRQAYRVFWSLVILTLIAGELTGMLPGGRLQLLVSVVLWGLGEYFIMPKVSNTIDAAQRNDLKDAVRHIAHLQVFLVCGDAYLRYALEEGQRK